MQGYNDGFEVCANNQPSNNPSTPSSYPTPQKPAVGNPIQSLKNDQVVFGLVLVIVIALIIYAIKKAVKRGKHKERRDFSDLIKESVLKKQNHRCAYCKRILNVVDWHHKMATDQTTVNQIVKHCVQIVMQPKRVAGRSQPKERKSHRGH
jgi:hypothetical protein